MVHVTRNILLGTALVSGLLWASQGWSDWSGVDFDHPVVIVPGIYSSKLTVQIKDPDSELSLCFGTPNLTLWMNMTLFTSPKLFGCFIELLKTTKNNSDIATFHAPGFGDSDTISNLGDDHNQEATAYMSPLLTALKKFGIKKVHGAVFDFRYSPDHLQNADRFYDKLTKLITDSYDSGKQKRVVLVCHSMGCLLSLLFMQSKDKEFKDKYIERMVTIAGAYGGSVNSLVGLTYGYDFHMSLGLEYLHGFRSAFRTQQASYFMLPNPDIFPKDKEVATVGEQKFTPSDLPAFFEAIDFAEGTNKYEDTMNTGNVSIGPGVDVYCLYGIDLPTIEKVIVPSVEALDAAATNETYVFGNGDGVVNEVSLRVCEQWKDLNDGHLVRSASYPKADHMKILQSGDMHTFLFTVALRLKKIGFLARLTG